MILAILCSLLAFLPVVPVYAKLAVIVLLNNSSTIPTQVPLYSYPSKTATIVGWPALQFYVIVNPDSGPGAANSQPDSNYRTAVAALRSHANVLLLGYVHTSYGDPTAYSLAGIFFDETQPGLTAKYTSYTAAARSAAWPGRTTGYVILNPGEDIGGSNYYSLADQIVTFEDTYAEYQDQAPLPLPHPAQQSVLIHTFTGTAQALVSVVQTLQTSGFASTYITNLNLATTDVYGSFGSDFAEFVGDANGAGPTSG
ncbi:Spherulation-specific family 4-domain-containing protein [Mycena vulgaris]|nr:Spherulation-specific family 4-domain-containing protein [Mycena vulgaris]